MAKLSSAELMAIPTSTRCIPANTMSRSSDLPSIHALAPSADALHLLVEDRIFLGGGVARRVVFAIRHVIRKVAGPRLTMANRRGQDDAMDGRVGGRSFAPTLCKSPTSADQSQEHHRDDRRFHAIPSVSKRCVSQPTPTIINPPAIRTVAAMKIAVSNWVIIQFLRMVCTSIGRTRV